MSTSLDAMRNYYDELGGYFAHQSGVTSESLQWHAYFCGYVRGINEYEAQGRYGDYGIVYGTFNGHNAKNGDWFHEGFVRALVRCLHEL